MAKPTYFTATLDSMQSMPDGSLQLTLVAPLEALGAAALVMQWLRTKRPCELALRTEGRGGMTVPATVHMVSVNAAVTTYFVVQGSDIGDFSTLHRLLRERVLCQVSDLVADEMKEVPTA